MPSSTPLIHHLVELIRSAGHLVREELYELESDEAWLLLGFGHGGPQSRLAIKAAIARERVARGAVGPGSPSSSDLQSSPRSLHAEPPQVPLSYQHEDQTFHPQPVSGMETSD